MITKHFFYGVPGVGKSTIASQIAARDHLLYIELDEVRSKTQAYVTKEKEPFIYEYSTEAWKRFGELNKENSIKGFLAVRTAFQKYIQKELDQHGVGYVAEAVYVDPNSVILDNETAITLIVTRDEKLHYSHFFLHREHGEEEDNQFRVARYVQEHLIDEANKLGVKVLENNNVDPSML